MNWLMFSGFMFCIVAGAALSGAPFLSMLAAYTGGVLLATSLGPKNK